LPEEHSSSAWLSLVRQRGEAGGVGVRGCLLPEEQSSSPWLCLVRQRGDVDRSGGTKTGGRLRSELAGPDEAGTQIHTRGGSDSRARTCWHHGAIQ